MNDDRWHSATLSPTARPLLAKIASIRPDRSDSIANRRRRWRHRDFPYPLSGDARRIAELPQWSELAVMKPADRPLDVLLVQLAAGVPGELWRTLAPPLRLAHVEGIAPAFSAIDARARPFDAVVVHPGSSRADVVELVDHLRGRGHPANVLLAAAPLDDPGYTVALAAGRNEFDIDIDERVVDLAAWSDSDPPPVLAHMLGYLLAVVEVATGRFPEDGDPRTALPCPRCDVGCEGSLDATVDPAQGGMVVLWRCNGCGLRGRATHVAHTSADISADAIVRRMREHGLQVAPATGATTQVYLPPVLYYRVLDATGVLPLKRMLARARRTPAGALVWGRSSELRDLAEHLELEAGFVEGESQRSLRRAQALLLRPSTIN
jgi:hypothetical protein